jgi:hypothetical protein
LIEGKIYTIRWYAVNAKGQGPASDEIIVGLTDRLAAPAGLLKVGSLSSKTSITMQWSALTGGVSPAGDILGYKLQV